MINEILLLREELAHLWSNFTYAKKKKKIADKKGIDFSTNSFTAEGTFGIEALCTAGCIIAFQLWTIQAQEAHDCLYVHALFTVGPVGIRYLIIY